MADSPQIKPSPRGSLSARSAVSERLVSRKRRHDFALSILLPLIDLLAVALGLIAAYALRFHSVLFEVTQGYLPGDYLRLAPIAIACWLFSMSCTHMYRRSQKVWSWRIAGRLVRASLLAMVTFATILFFARNLTTFPLARWMIPLSLLTVPGLIMIERTLLHRYLKQRMQRDGRGLAKALVLGTGSAAKEIARSMRRHPELGWRVVGFLTQDQAEIGEQRTGIDVLDVLDRLSDILEERPEIEAVYIAQPALDSQRLEEIFWECQKRMVDVKQVPEISQMLFGSVDVEEVDGLPIVGLRQTPLQGWLLVLKSVLDIVGAAAILLLTCPILLLVALLNRRDGSVFYRQERIGTDGKLFSIIKFRTMRPDAEKNTGPVFSEGLDDPRQTSFGRFLRQSHIDELPQMLNVLRGEMSLVGPRPERPHFVEQFREEVPRYMARHRIKSGVTGWAQVLGQAGEEGTIGERVKLDLYYIENWSPLFDLKILILTVLRVLKRLRKMQNSAEKNSADLAAKTSSAHEDSKSA